MKRIYDNFLYDEHGMSIPLSADDLIVYLTDELHAMRTEKDIMEKKLRDIQSILSSDSNNLTNF